MPKEIKIEQKIPEQISEQEIVPEQKPEAVFPEEKQEVPVSPKPEIKEEVKKSEESPQVKMLCDLALQEGVEEATKKARELGSFYVDELHKKLTGELRKKLNIKEE